MASLASSSTSQVCRIEENNHSNQATRRRGRRVDFDFRSYIRHNCFFFFLAYLTDVMNLARSRGLVTLLAKDEYGDEWLEIRSTVATYRVPKYNYPTHLCRLIVDSSLGYFVEVLGHCVRKGSLYKDSTHSLNQTETASILTALEGGHVVCQGIESVYKQVPDLHMKTAQELGLSDDMYLTLPDYRYRSHDCLMWIDRRLGPRCLACCQSTSMSSDDEYSRAPIDLRCNTNHPQLHEH